ncbi:MAG: GntR family transcriptional regulator [Proteobacteria bacterium]|nr:GntR family transcriptional regulator [Pseudomonadota bacterium]MBI3505659.1 GntR family transcriptional regulator [Pseudomonadota bacterium]
MQLTTSDGIAAIRRQTLHGEIVSAVRDMIIEERLPPGIRIHEVQLCAALGVSRTPLREALKVLASEGLIDLVPGRGAVVRKASPEEVLDVLNVLGALEERAATLAVAAASEAEIAAVRQLHERMMERYREHDRLEYFKLNQAIHNAIVELSRNATLAAVHHTLQARIKRVRFLGNRMASQWQDAVGEHDEMIRALEARDGDGLAEVLGRHMAETWERVRAAL